MNASTWSRLHCVYRPVSIGGHRSASSTRLICQIRLCYACMCSTHAKNDTKIKVVPARHSPSARPSIGDVEKGSTSIRSGNRKAFINIIRYFINHPSAMRFVCLDFPIDKKLCNKRASIFVLMHEPCVCARVCVGGCVCAVHSKHFSPRRTKNLIE